MGKLTLQLKKHRETLTALAAALICLFVAGLVWLVAVRPNVTKSASLKVSDDYTLYSVPLEDGQSADQSFTLGTDLYALAFVFGNDGTQPTGELALTLSDTDTGEVLATSSGELGNILPGQYTGMGLNTTVEGYGDRNYTVTLTPHYTGSGRLTIGHSDGATLWDNTFTVNGQPVAGTMSLVVTYDRIGGFLTRFFLLISLAACLIVFFGVRAAMRGKTPLYRLVFALVLSIGMLYSFVLPPYAAPDEKYHINQSFTLACRWANTLSSEEWRMGNIPITMSYRREHDFDERLQDEKTSVFTWKDMIVNLPATTPDSFDSHVELDELQTDTNPIPYLASAAVVFLCFVLHLGFVPTLLLGRFANLLVFALLAAFAVKAAPFGKRVFAAVALLPMTLHLAVSFSRDSLLLGLCFVFTALSGDAVFGKRTEPLTLRKLLPLGIAGLLLAPAKAVYLPLAGLVLLIPSMRLGARPLMKKLAYLAACVLLTVTMNTGLLAHGTGEATAPATAPDAATEVQATSVDTTAPEISPAATPANMDVAAATENPPTEINAEPSNVFPEELKENTAENFVRRLFYCAEGATDVPPPEIDFWVQALQEKDVNTTLLGQSFFFGVNSELSDEEFVDAVYLVYLNRLPDNWADLLAGSTEGTGGRRLLMLNTSRSEEATALLSGFGFEAGNDDADHYPLDRATLQAEIENARAVRASQSVASEQDSICYTPAYILGHLPDTALLVMRSVINNGDQYLCTLVGGSLSYYSLDLAWFWVVALYLLLAFAAAPSNAAQDTVMLPQNNYRVWYAVAALLCCALVVAGCITWTPTYYETIYGLQGRYFLPILPLLLLTCVPRVFHVKDEAQASAQLICALCLVNLGVLINAMLAVIAR